MANCLIHLIRTKTLIIMNRDTPTHSSYTDSNASPAAPSASDRGKAKSREAAAVAQSKVEEVKTAAREKGEALVEEAKAQARSAIASAQKAGTSLVNDQKNNLAEKVGEYEKAARAAASKLHDENNDAFGKQVDRLANQLGRVREYLHDSDPEHLWGDAERMTRRNPEVVLGTMFLAGLVAARFLKASRHKRRAEEDSYPHPFEEDQPGQAKTAKQKGAFSSAATAGTTQFPTLSSDL